MTRVLAAVAVAALVVLAGCGGAPATQTSASGPDATADGTTTGTSTSDGEARQRVTVPSNLVPPGASSRAITNPRQLLGSHLETLSNTTYRTNATYTKLYTRGNFESEGTVHYDLASVGERFSSTQTTFENGTESATDVYRNTESVFIRNRNATDTTYRSGTGPVRLRLQTYRSASRPGVRQVLFLYMQLASNMQATGFSNINGEKVVKYQATNANSSLASRYGSVLGAPNGTLEDFSLTVYVDRDGVVHRASGSMELARENGETRERSLSYRVSKVGDVTMNEPAWTDEIPRLNGTHSGNNTMLSVENVGNATLSNYSVTVGGNVTAERSVNGSLEPGETVYMYVTGSGNDTVLHVNETRPDVPADARTIPSNARTMVYFGSPKFVLTLGVFKNTSNANQNGQTSGSMGTVGASVTSLQSFESLQQSTANRTLRVRA